MQTTLTERGFAISRDDEVAVLTSGDADCVVEGREISISECVVTVDGTRNGREVTTIRGRSDDVGVELTWTLEVVADRNEVEVTLAVRNCRETPVQIGAMTVLRGIIPSFASGCDYSYLKLAAGSWNQKSIEPLEDEGESELVGALVDDAKSAAVCGFLSTERFRGFARWSRGLPEEGVQLEAFHEIGSGRSARSAAGWAMDKMDPPGGQDAEHADSERGDTQARTPGTLGPGEALKSERVHFALDSVFSGLERWAQKAGEFNGALFMNPPATGLYTWYYYREHVSEEVVLSNARFLAANRDRFPVNYVHLDWGWQNEFSCGTQEVRPDFEHGLAWLASEVRKLGFVPGIWLNAFMHDHPTSSLVVEQPELFQAHPDGTPATFGEPLRNNMAEIWPEMATHREGRQYRVDPTASPVPAYLRRRYGWARDQGFGLVMLDFFLNGVVPLQAAPADPSVTWECALRSVMREVRAAVGPYVMVMGCGAPYEPMMGLANFVRVANDVMTCWDSLRRGCKLLLLQYFMHNRLWTNYADCLSIRGSSGPYWRTGKHGEPLGLSLDEARFYVAVTGLSGASVMIAEDISRLEPDRQELLTLILPICDGGHFRPIDMFPGDEPRIIRRTYSMSDRSWAVIGILNWSDSDDSEQLTYADLISDADDWSGSCAQLFHAYDVYGKSHLGIVQPDQFVGTVPAHGALLLRLTPVAAHPSLVGTTTHISQGCAEVLSEIWNDTERSLEIRMLDLDGRCGSFFVAVPPGLTLVEGEELVESRNQADGWNVVQVPVVLSAGRSAIVLFRSTPA